MNTGGLCCRFVTHARGLQTAQVPLAPSRGLRGVCEILDGVVRAFGAEVTRRKELGFGLRGAKGFVHQPSGSCQTDK